ncbi:hypothetical protein AO392_00335 [Pseudomonas putida]|nr:hypothetical protein AO392_00335 [Pseudomonas putida]
MIVVRLATERASRFFGQRSQGIIQLCMLFNDFSVDCFEPRTCPAKLIYRILIFLELLEIIPS